MKKFSPSEELSFQGKLPEEHIHYIFVKHWITSVPEAILTILFYLAPIGAVMILVWIMNIQVYLYIFVLIGLYIPLCGLLLFIRWMNIVFDVFLLSDKRLIDITQYGLLHRRITIAELNQIQHVTYNSKGIVDTIFNVGVIDVKTAGSNPDIVLEVIEDPARTADLILDFAQQYQK